MDEWCLVFGCCNRKGEGVFIGNLCSPCYDMITTGVIGRGTTFVHEQRDLLATANGELQARVAAEDTDKDRELYAMQDDHRRALIREEEKGYARGIADMES